MPAALRKPLQALPWHCPPLACTSRRAAQERELGNDAYALGRWDAAVAHYSRALADPLGAADASLHANRAAAYLAKGW